MPAKFKILSLRMETISKDWREAIEYTRTYPWMPMACLEAKIENSSWPAVSRVLLLVRDGVRSIGNPISICGRSV